MTCERTLLHTRAATFQGFLRADGLWDIEAEMHDTRDYDSLVLEKQLLPANAPLHHLFIRLVLDDALTIQNISARMQATPFNECRQMEDALQCMRGVTLGTGWRKTINDRLGGVRGCTHLGELLFNMATVAFQTVSAHRAQQHRRAGQTDSALTDPPYFLDRCHAWRLDGPVVLRHLPQFHRRDQAQTNEAAAATQKASTGTVTSNPTASPTTKDIP